jgi:UDP-2,3-diacylglucosamine pyrophosphatase LpxH
MAMPLDQTSTWERLSALWTNAEFTTLPTVGRRYVILSDLHMGDGGGADDLTHNELALLYALEYYRQESYDLILLGDIEEFWQFDLSHIIRRYGDTVYAAIRCYGNSRIYRVYGNHDYEWSGLADPTRNGAHQPALATEALGLQGPDGGVALLLTHGHQGSLESDKYAWFSRFFVRLFRGVEPLVAMIGLYRRGSATKSRVARDYERMMYAWARDHHAILICGHSHRPIFASRSPAEALDRRMAQVRARSAAAAREGDEHAEYEEQMLRLRQALVRERLNGRAALPVEPGGEPLPCYFNSGCALYGDGLTALEIADGYISLVRWGPESAHGPDTGPAIVRHLYDTANLADLIARIKRL